MVNRYSMIYSVGHSIESELADGGGEMRDFCDRWTALEQPHFYQIPDIIFKIVSF